MEHRGVAAGSAGGDIGARATFEWMPGETFLLQRWQAPVPEAPDGLAVIGYDEGRGTLLQHYFDWRGVARVYEMSLEDGVWKLQRDRRLLPAPFDQRFEGHASPKTARRSRAAGRSATPAATGRRTST